MVDDIATRKEERLQFKENEMTKITPEQKNEISVANARQFLAECPEFYGSEYNAELMQQWIINQVGAAYPMSLDNFWCAYEYLSEHGRFEPRPVETAPAPAVRQSSGIVSEIVGVLADDQATADKFKSLGNGGTNKPLTKKSLTELKAEATKQRVAIIEERGDTLAQLQQRGKYSS
jgi:hypothetical protein